MDVNNIGLTSTNARALQRAEKIVKPALCAITRHFIYVVLINIGNKITLLWIFEA